MKCGYFNTKIGIIKISYDEKIKKIELVEKALGENTEDEIFTFFKEQILEFLEGKREFFERLDFLEISGTDFEVKVFKALLKVPYGKTISYKDLAQMVGSPRAYRAVGTAVGKNPFLIIIPCHRVVKSDGSLGGFAYESEVKKELLKIES
ncbi:methylated-DNA--[protein]-cysteine S-methyltransferase [uncultured Anaerococcus sp.]|uniref:methylated-DNA--[protein]-cysteine S-methyltransferase n=1 Tax=uncultured Anaerococcus sp. TaxID=293428 RepID=UPI0025F3F1B5|nr:methylated-DNA--[protein]-cysteine S-methyltransferase [uncultured Anaerococcus sp.]